MVGLKLLQIKLQKIIFVIVGKGIYKNLENNDKNDKNLSV